MFAIAFALKWWQCYLYGVESILYIEHHLLKYWLTQEKSNSCQARWLEFLQEFHFKVRYKSGKSNVVANALSRFPMEINTVQVTRIVPTWISELPPLYLQCSDFSTSYEKTKTRELLVGKRGVYTLQDSLVYFFNTLCIPSIKDHRKRIMEDLHDSYIGGHFGFLKTLQRIKSHYYWPSM